MCGVFGIWGHPEAANITYLGLHALQHRGQESAGIATTDGDQLFAHRVMGLVQAGFQAADLAALRGTAAIGHVRYSTAGSSHLRNAQPLAVDYAHGSIALAHNGNLTNHDALRTELESKGSIFQTGTDTETIVHCFARSHESTAEDRLIDALRKVEGAYSLVALTEKKMIAIRDPMGIRPLVVGVLKKGDQSLTVIASEPTSFDLIGAELVRDVAPGEMVIIDETGTRSVFPFEGRPRAMCLFEYVYFARPDAQVDGVSVYNVRKALGRKLAEEHPLADQEDAIVVPVPDSGVPAAIGYAVASGISFEVGLIRSHYVGRTFIEPQETIRDFGVRLKLHPNRATIEGKRVIVVDDSIVRGTTSRKIVKMIREAGAREVHFRVSSPPTKWPCFYGIATPTRQELIANTHNEVALADYLAADSVGYLSLPSLVDAVRTEARIEQAKKDTPLSEPPETGSLRGYCHACFSGEYPIPIPRGGGDRAHLLKTMG